MSNVQSSRKPTRLTDAGQQDAVQRFDAADAATGRVAWSPPSANWGRCIPIPLTLFAAAALAVSLVDVPVARARLHAQLARPLPAVFDRLETFGHGVGIGVVLLAVWSLDPARRRFVPRLLAASLGAGMAANVVKLCVGRLRPFAWIGQEGGTLPSQFIEWFPLGLNTSIEQSFPSAHTAAAVGLALGLSALYPHGAKLFAGVAMMVAAQRAIFCVHYVSDVLAGAGVAWIVVLALFRVSWITRLFNRWEQGAATSDRPVVPLSRVA